MVQIPFYNIDIVTSERPGTGIKTAQFILVKTIVSKIHKESTYGIRGGLWLGGGVNKFNTAKGGPFRLGVERLTQCAKI